MSEAEFEPRIIAFLCNWCTYTGADLAGTSRIQYPPNVRIIRLMCSGGLDPVYVSKALLEGADGVLIGGCHPGDCHYQSGNYKARRRVAILQSILAQMHLATAAAVASTFRVLHMSDTIDLGDNRPELVASRRLAVMINKYWTAMTSTACARDGIELLGGGRRTLHVAEQHRDGAPLTLHRSGAGGGLELLQQLAGDQFAEPAGVPARVGLAGTRVDPVTALHAERRLGR